MNSQTFKTEIKKVSSQLKGMTLQLITSSGATPFNTLKEFGNAILNEEKNGNSFSIGQAWTVNGAVAVNSFDQLAQMLNTSVVTGVQFKSFYAATNFSDYLKNGFGTND